jgi:type VI secretion system Hcp family effector
LEAAWKDLRKGCAEALRSKSKDLCIALWWTEASALLDGFSGFTEGVRLVNGLWRHHHENLDEGLADVVAGSLETSLLQVTLAESLTFTTVINSRSDSELASQIQQKVACRREYCLGLLSELSAVEKALRDFQERFGSDGHALPTGFEHLRNLVADMRRTFEAWAALEDVPRSAPAELVEPPNEPDFRIFLWVQGIRGESDAPRHQGWIEGTAYTQTMRRPRTSAEVHQTRIKIRKRLDRSSPELYDAAHTGRVFSNVTMDVCRNTGQVERFLRIEMSDATITEVRHSGISSSQHSRPAETVTFEYRRIQWIYTKLRQPDARPEGNTSSVWTRPVPSPESRRTG